MLVAMSACIAEGSRRTILGLLKTFLVLCIDEVDDSVLKEFVSMENLSALKPTYHFGEILFAVMSSQPSADSSNQAN